VDGVILNTDYEWFEFLRAQPPLDEVNFWRPSDTRKPGLAPGTPVIFKLKKSHGNSIVGFGVFASHSVVQAWVAWEAFERKNGAASFAEMLALIAKSRRRAGEDPMGTGQYPIGCLMLSAPIFFDRKDWIPAPEGWPANVVQGKAYDLSAGEGARIWQHCQAVARATQAELQPGALVMGTPAPRYGEAMLIRPRLGQGSFRIMVTDAYGRACAVTGEHSLPVLEAAHIRPYADEGPHEVSNGLLLRTDIHRLFDKGYVTISPDHRFLVSRRLKDEYENGKTYYALHGKSIQLPKLAADRPGAANLEWHARERYRESA
jgi:putative restriction endonuclease